jgi:CMP-N-acetylneuraminic acid synthetase
LTESIELIPGLVTALMPMKAHSERVENKNLRPFAGDPLFYHVLRSLQAAKFIGEICINTDSSLIAQQLEMHFPEVIVHWRPPEICGDFVSMNRIIENDLDSLEGQFFLQTHSTNPLMKSTTIDNAITSWIDKIDDHDSLFSVTPHQSRFFDSTGKAVNHDPGDLIRTQDLPPLYEENSCLYLFSRDTFAFNKNRIGRQPLMFPVPPLEAVDIDTQEEFMLAEALFNYLAGSENTGTDQ